MATATGKLTAVAIKAAGAGKLADGGGLFLDVRANGSRYWRMKYRHAGKEKLLAFGVYPEVTLAEARRGDDVMPRARRSARAATHPVSARPASCALCCLPKQPLRPSPANGWTSNAPSWRRSL